jgi:hypothetical protein
MLDVISPLRSKPLDELSPTQQLTSRTKALHYTVMAGTDPWREYRTRRNLSLFAALGFVPFVYLLIRATVWLFGTAIPAFFVAFGWVIFAWIAGRRFIDFKCPRCGNLFFADSKWWGYNTMVRKCLHCKLPLNTPVASDGSIAPRT